MFQHSQPWVPGSQLWLPCHITPGELKTIHAGAPIPREMDLTSPGAPASLWWPPSLHYKRRRQRGETPSWVTEKNLPMVTGRVTGPPQPSVIHPLGPHPLWLPPPATVLSTSSHEVALLSRIGSLPALQQVSVFTGTEAKCF